MTITYSFRSGTRVSGVDAQTAGDELARIVDEHGELTAPLVVDESRPQDAPLHPVFEWDDQTAAELHRQHQARNLIRAVQVMHDEDAKPEPVYVHVSSEGSYLPAEEVVQRVDLYEQAYRDACERLGQAQHSLSQLAALAERLRPETVQRTRRTAEVVKRIHEQLTAV
jgi:hypothetical protein